MPVVNNDDWRLRQIEERVKTLGERTHSISTAVTQNTLAISYLQGEVSKTAEKEDVDELKSEVSAINSTILKASIAIAGSSLTLTISIVVAFIIN